MLSALPLSLYVLAAENAPQEQPIIWVPTIVVCVLMLIGLISFSYMTKAGIIARATTKEAIRQPIFLLCLGLAIVILLVNFVVPFFTLGEDVKMVKDCGLATI